MRSQFFEEGDVDGTDGQCCLKYNNAKGVRYILIWDLFFIITIIRPILACLVMSNYRHFAAYTRCRKCTFWLYSIILFGSLFAYVAYDVILQAGEHYMQILGALMVAILIVLTDFHWTKVVEFHNKHPELHPSSKVKKGSQPPPKQPSADVGKGVAEKSKSKKSSKDLDTS